jgi:cyclic pyranopterin phosphate synthase
MVDVSAKPATAREAAAAARIWMTRDAARLAQSGVNRKGDAVQTARLAGVMAAKRTAEMIPLCHPLQLSHVDVEIRPLRDGFDIEARVRTTGPTGVEMEALTAVSIAALTLYDMIKAVDRTMEIGGIRLLEKRGGRSGTFTASRRRPRRTR